MLPTGLCAFPLTPMDAQGHVLADELGGLVSRLAAAGVDAIGLLGSTGTYAYLSRAERRRAIEVAQDHAGGVPLVVGIGALRTDEAVALAQDARALGAVAGLLAPVSYTPLTGDEVFAHFETVARQSGLPLCIYDNPGTTHFTFAPDLVARLARLPGIIGIKNPPPAGAVAPHLAAQRAALPAGFSIGYSGDWCAAEALAAGADLWHSVLGGLFPRRALAMAQAARQGETAGAARLEAALAPLWALFRRYSSLRVIHELARQSGLTAAPLPRPILPLPEAVRADLAAWLARHPDPA